MKKVLLLALVLLTFSAGLFAQYGYGDEKRIEFSITGGFALGNLDAASDYANTWSWRWLTEVNESTAITQANKNSFSLGASLAYYLSPNFGIQIGGAYFAPKADITSAWAADFTYIGESTVDLDGTFAMTQGNLTSIPLYINLIGKYRAGMFDIFASVGPTLFINSFDATADAVWGASVFSGIYPFFGTQWVDFFDIALDIPKTSWTGFGFNAGAGVDIKFSPSVAFTFEARYFYCPAKEFAWDWLEGTYSSFYYKSNSNFNNWDISDLTYEESVTSLFKINPSFLSLSGGFKFLF